MKNQIKPAVNILNMDELLPNLKNKKEENDQTAFNELVEQVLSGIRQYVARRLKWALKNRSIPSGKYKVDDFVDELYLMAYEQIHEVEDYQDLYRWLLAKADKLLEETIEEEEFDHLFFENIDNFSQPEWDAMEEHFSTDGDGDLVMEEELDDLAYAKHDYTLQDIFVEDYETGLIEKLNKEMKQEQFQQHVDQVLTRLPVLMRTIFDLNIYQKIAPKYIATIKKIPLNEVQKQLLEAKKWVRLSFINKGRKN